MDFNYRLQPYFLKFKTPFAIAHGTRDGTDIVLLHLTCENITAIGEASLPPYLAENKESVNEFIYSFFKDFKFTNDLNTCLEYLHQHKSGNYAAKACIDIALHNWFAAYRQIPVWELLGLKNNPLPPCTFTIGMGAPDVIREKVKEAHGFNMIKVKLGGEHDKQIIETILDCTDTKLCVDVNQGWKDPDFALDMIHWLAERNIVFVEQPLPKSDKQGQQWLFQKSPLPIIADEAVQTIEDIDAVKDFYHGINVKLMKCGGISPGLAMVREAKSLQKLVLVGSMSETSCGIMAAAQLSSLANWVDLDGPLLASNNPFENVNYKNGILQI